MKTVKEFFTEHHGWQPKNEAEAARKKFDYIDMLGFAAAYAQVIVKDIEKATKDEN